jgi:CubicO group peptidase (beta-lactamase class C family)/uncharacterized protein (DUF302 family)
MRRTTGALSLLASVALATPSTADLAQTAAAPQYKIWRGSPALQSHGVYIDQMIADFVTKNHLPGLSMAIVQAPYVPRSGGYGRTNLSNDELASTKTMWNIGPITQAFTAVAIFQLKEAHRLDIHDPVGKYVPALPANWARISILDLLRHSSGIPDFRAGGAAPADMSPADIVASVARLPLLFKPGTEVRHSATNFILLGLVIEAASDTSFHDYITKNQIEPIGLTATMFTADFATRSFADRPTPVPGENQHVRFKSEVPFINPVEPATGYREAGGTMVPIDMKASRSLFAFGDLWSSAEDISKWDIALAGSTLVKDAADRSMIYSPTTLSNGIVVPAMAGWEFTHHPGFMEIKGSSPGFSSYLSRFTASDELVCVTLLTNKEGVDLTVLARSIADAYDNGLGSDADPKTIVAQESKFSVDDTVARLTKQLADAKVPLFATYDHGANARAVGLELRPTKVLVFGNPQVGTKLMLDRQPSAIELPLRILVWEDARKRIWVGYPNMNAFAADYGLKDNATIDGLTRFLGGIVDRSVNVYAY